MVRHLAVFLFAVSLLPPVAGAHPPLAENAWIVTFPPGGAGTVVELPRRAPGAFPLDYADFADPSVGPALGTIFGGDFVNDSDAAFYFVDTGLGTPHLRSADMATYETTDIGALVLDAGAPEPGTMRWDRVGGEMYLMSLGSGPSVLQRVNLADATTVVVGQLVLSGSPGMVVQSIAVHPTTGQMYGIRTGTPSRLLEIDKTTGECTEVGDLGLTLDGSFGFRRNSIEFEDSTGDLFLLGKRPSASMYSLRRVNITTGESRLVSDITEDFVGVELGTFASSSTYTGTFEADPLGTRGLFGISAGHAVVSDMSLPSGFVDLGAIIGPESFSQVSQGDFAAGDTGTFYFASTSTRGLYRMDTATRVATLVGTLTIPVVEFPISLGWDSTEQRMLLVTTTAPDDRLYEVNLDTAAASFLTNVTGTPRGLQGIAMQPGTGTLFAVNYWTSQLCTINLATGTTTVVGALGFSTATTSLNVQLTFEPDTLDLYLRTVGRSTFDSDGWYRVDPSTGDTVQVSHSNAAEPVAPEFSALRLLPNSTTASATSEWSAYE
jgi:hypothetical protein